MRKRHTKVDKATIAADRATLKAIQNLGTYQPLNPALSIENLVLLEQSLTQAELADERAIENRHQTLDIRIDTGGMFHDAMISAKDQVKALFGNDSYEVKAIGLTRKSDRKQGSRG